MYVTPFFKDDVDMKVARKQHAVYSQALGIIVSQCNLYAEFTRRLLDDAEHPAWGTVGAGSRRGGCLLTKGTTEIGFTNRNNQTVICKTNRPETDHEQTVYKTPVRRLRAHPRCERFGHLPTALPALRFQEHR